MMARMMTALAPLIVASTYFFGWRVFVMVGIVTLAGLITEYLTARQRSQSISMACFVTCWLYSMSLPATMPFWQAVVGIVVAILFGKEVFGGFGRNWANPAIVGRAFVYVAFPTPMTGGFVPTFRGFPGGFAHWSMASPVSYTHLRAHET